MTSDKITGLKLQNQNVYSVLVSQFKSQNFAAQSGLILLHETEGAPFLNKSNKIKKDKIRQKLGKNGENYTKKGKF